MPGESEDHGSGPEVPRGRTMILARSDEGRATECLQFRTPVGVVVSVADGVLVVW